MGVDFLAKQRELQCVIYKAFGYDNTVLRPYDVTIGKHASSREAPELKPSRWGDILLGAHLVGKSITGQSIGSFSFPGEVIFDFPFSTYPNVDEGASVYWGTKPEPLEKIRCDHRGGMTIYYRKFRITAPCLLYVFSHRMDAVFGGNSHEKSLYLPIGIDSIDSETKARAKKAWEDAWLIIKRMQDFFQNPQMNRKGMFNKVLSLLRDESVESFQAPSWCPRTLMRDIDFLSARLHCPSSIIYSHGG